MNMIEARKKQRGLVLLICGFLAYLFLATFHPFLHNHPFLLSNKHHCECHRTHEESHSEDHKSQDDHKHCPACDFLSKAYNTTIQETTTLSFANHRIDNLAFPTYQNPCQENYFSFYLQRAPPVIPTV